jgi:hypothetical protein
MMMWIQSALVLIAGIILAIVFVHVLVLGGFMIFHLLHS